MQLRSDPSASAMMAGAFTRANADQLQSAIGRAPSEGELYIAHFLGPDGAGKRLLVQPDVAGWVEWISGGSEVALNFTELLRCADLALYAAKERGKSRVEVYHDDLHTRMVSRATQRSEISTAMQSGQFELHYQPVVLIDSWEIVGSEALIRWQHPTRGLVMPAELA